MPALAVGCSSFLCIPLSTSCHLLKSSRLTATLSMCSYIVTVLTLPEYQGSAPMKCWEGNPKQGGLGSDYYRRTMADRHARSVTCNLPHHSTPAYEWTTTATPLGRFSLQTQQIWLWNSVEKSIQNEGQHRAKHQQWFSSTRKKPKNFEKCDSVQRQWQAVGTP